MPRDVSGNYTLPPLNPVVGGTVIDIAWANNTMGDIATQLNNVFTRDGVLGPTGTFKIIDGTLATPGLAFNSELGLGIFREAQNVLSVAIGGAVVARFKPTGVETVGGINKNATAIAIAEVPTGTILDFAGSTSPTGYLMCDGSAMSRTTFAALFAVIGATWGAGDGSTTFNLPDLRRRTTIGSGGTVNSGPGNALGNVGGVEVTTLALGHLPSHLHSITDQIHAHLVAVSGTSSAVSNDHQHYVSLGGGDHEHYTTLQSYWGSRNTGNVGWCSDDAPSAAGVVSNWTAGGGAHSHAGYTGGISANHTHTWSGTFASDNRYTGINTTNATGAGSAFNNMQPSAVVNKIIKY